MSHEAECNLQANEDARYCRLVSEVKRNTLQAFIMVLEMPSAHQFKITAIKMVRVMTDTALTLKQNCELWEQAQATVLKDRGIDWYRKNHGQSGLDVATVSLIKYSYLNG